MVLVKGGSNQRKPGDDSEILKRCLLWLPACLSVVATDNLLTPQRLIRHLCWSRLGLVTLCPDPDRNVSWGLGFRVSLGANSVGMDIWLLHNNIVTVNMLACLGANSFLINTGIYCLDFYHTLEKMNWGWESLVCSVFSDIKHHWQRSQEQLSKEQFDRVRRRDWYHSPVWARQELSLALRLEGRGHS